MSDTPETSSSTDLEALCAAVPEATALIRMVAAVAPGPANDASSTEWLQRQAEAVKDTLEGKGKLGSHGPQVSIGMAIGLLIRVRREIALLEPHAAPRDLPLLQESDVQAKFLLALLRNRNRGTKPEQPPKSVRRMPSLTARWLLTVAVRALPTASRARYTEEWQGELWELSGSGTRRKQTMHALRTLGSVWSLRASLREGLRRAAGG